VDDLATLWATLTEYARKAVEHANQGLTTVWSVVVEYLNVLVERVQAFPAEQLRLIAALICSTLVVVLILWVSTLRKLRKTRRALIEAQARCETLQAQYDAEVKWRTATERVEAARPPASPPQATQQPTSPVGGAPQGGANPKPKVAAPASPVRITTAPLMYHPGTATRAQGPTRADPDKTH